MTYQFGNCLYRSTSDLLDAIAAEFVTAGGMNSRETILIDMADETDEAMAAECITGWGFDRTGDDADEQTPLEQWGVTAADIAQAIGRYRASLAD